MTDEERERERLRLSEMGFRPEEIERQFDPAISDATKAAETTQVLMRTFQPLLDTTPQETAAVGRRIYERVAGRFFPDDSVERRRRRSRRSRWIGIAVALLLAGLAMLLVLRQAPSG